MFSWIKPAFIRQIETNTKPLSFFFLPRTVLIFYFCPNQLSFPSTQICITPHHIWSYYCYNYDYYYATTWRFFPQLDDVYTMPSEQWAKIIQFGCMGKDYAYSRSEKYESTYNGNYKQAELYK